MSKSRSRRRVHSNNSSPLKLDEGSAVERIAHPSKRTRSSQSLRYRRSPKSTRSARRANAVVSYAESSLEEQDDPYGAPKAKGRTLRSAPNSVSVSPSKSRRSISRRSKKRTVSYAEPSSGELGDVKTVSKKKALKAAAYSHRSLGEQRWSDRIAKGRSGAE